MKQIIFWMCSIYGVLPLVNENTLYIFCRGTATKAGMIAKRYNIRDSFITHTGIGYFENNKAYLFHVTDDRSVQNALQISSLQSFSAVKDLIHFSIWKITTEKTAFNRVKASLQQFSTRKIFFDTQFSLANKPDSLYCAEFCANVLNEAGIKCSPTSLRLTDEFAIRFLSRKFLLYFPADFFLQLDGIEKIYSFTIDQ